MFENAVKPDKNLLVISHAYNNFQKDPIELIAPYFLSIDVAVRTNSLIEITKYLPTQKFKVFSSTFKIDKGHIPYNIRVHQTPILYIPTDKGYKNLGTSHYLHVRNLIQKEKIKFDLVHSHFIWSAGYVGACLKKALGIPFVVTAHGFDIYSLPFKDKEWRKKIEYVLNTANCIITVSNKNFEYIKKLDVDTKVKVIPNGFRHNLFCPRNPKECIKALNLPNGKRIILTVGNLVPIKGHKYLIEAVNEIIQQRKDLLCVIVGTGTIRKAIEQQIKIYKLEEYFLLTGAKPHDEIPLWMNACDLFVLPSLNEGNPTVMFEALGCGKPFVGTNVGGVPEVITSDQYGLLVQPADSKDLAEKIIQALNRDWDRDAILKYAERYSWENIAKEILGVYEQVLG